MDSPALVPVRPLEQIPLVTARLHELLLTNGAFDDIYRHILAAPGKRVRARLVLATAGLLRAETDPAPVATSFGDAIDLACAMEMFHESSLVHDDICDGSLLRRGAASVAAEFGVRTSARLGFHMAGVALESVARVIDANPVVFAGIGTAPGVTYADRLSDLSFGQLIETLPPSVDVDVDALRRHYELVAGAKTGTLFRLSCSYGGTAGGVNPERLQALMEYADQLGLAFQIMDDVRDIEGGVELGKDAGGDLERRVPTWPVIEWLANRPGAHELWLSDETTSEFLQADLIESGATKLAREAAVAATDTASRALEVFGPSPARDDLRALLHEVISR
ncbi:polyprenyl synthetase family protein [Nocardia camponoti]|uniref:Polyprenyl synthetase n=1 Tax=Nocardia camponoti TaxID=1616106 RepID=A0A917V6W6_9NOCA|nr:polyprenyl synthetase family protein [Nocardia camponoti]GGK47294.1 polyprenyl synthetase [Nocardia camponoti]